MSAKEELMKYILSLNEKQVDRIVEHMDLIRCVASMTDNELIYSETFLTKLFGKGETA